MTDKKDEPSEVMYLLRYILGFEETDGHTPRKKKEE